MAVLLFFYTILFHFQIHLLLPQNVVSLIDLLTKYILFLWIKPLTELKPIFLAYEYLFITKILSKLLLIKVYYLFFQLINIILIKYFYIYRNHPKFLFISIILVFFIFTFQMFLLTTILFLVLSLTIILSTKSLILPS